MPTAVDAKSSQVDSSKSHKLSRTKSPLKKEASDDDDDDEEDDDNDHKTSKKVHKNSNVIKVLAVRKPSQNENQMILKSSKPGESKTSVGLVKYEEKNVKHHHHHNKNSNDDDDDEDDNKKTSKNIQKHNKMIEKV